MNNIPPLLITKASGEQVPFLSEKLFHSLKRSGASEQIIESVIEQVRQRLYPGISTKKIYQLAYKILKNKSRKTAAKYKLKRAIMEFGPSGFPFELFIAEILKKQGFRTKVGEIVKGHCVNHEIDVIAEKENLYFMIECKFHNQPGYSCDVKIPLYIQARFEDVEKQWRQIPGNGKKFHQGWLVTNTKFTIDAIKYGTCIGLNLLGWDFPEKNSLRELIDKSGLYPLTCLTKLTLSEKHLLMDNKIILCREIISNPELLSKANISGPRRELIINEAVDLCKNSSS